MNIDKPDSDASPRTAKGRPFSSGPDDNEPRPLSYARRVPQGARRDLGTYAVVLGAVTLVGSFFAAGLASPRGLRIRVDDVVVAALIARGATVLLAGFAVTWAIGRRPIGKRRWLLTAGILMLCAAAYGIYTSSNELSCRLAVGKSLQCRMNLRYIGQALHIYADDHDAFPPDLDTLLAAGHLKPDVLQCPWHRQAEVKRWDYKYVAGLSLDDPSDYILAFEYPPRCGRSGTSGHILYLDGHAEGLTAADMARELARFRQRLSES